MMYCPHFRNNFVRTDLFGQFSISSVVERLTKKLIANTADRKKQNDEI